MNNGTGTSMIAQLNDCNCEEKCPLSKCRRRRHDGGKGFKPLVIYDTAQKKLSPHQHTYWANFYQENRRDPSNIEPAPWVKARLGDLAWK